MNKFPLYDLLSTIDDYSIPSILGEVNNSPINLMKVKGNVDWHSHHDRDKMLLVLKGEFEIFFKSHEVILKPYDCLIIPKGTFHSASAHQETWLFLME